MSEPRPPRRRLRSFGAVFLGFLAIVVLSTVTDLAMHATGVFAPPGQPMGTGLWLLATAYRIVYSILGCYLAARLAPDRPMQHALVLGIVGVVVSLVGVAATWGKGPGFGPVWYPLGLVVVALPCAWVGGKLFERRAGVQGQAA